MNPLKQFGKYQYILKEIRPVILGTDAWVELECIIVSTSI